MVMRTTASSGASPLASEHCALLPMPSACPSPPQLMMRTTASSGASLLSVRPSAAASGTATSTATLSCAHAWQQEVQRRWQVCVWGGRRAAQGRGVLEGSPLIPRPYPPCRSCCGARRGKPAALPFASLTLRPCPSSSPPSCPVPPSLQLLWCVVRLGTVPPLSDPRGITPNQGLPWGESECT